jgi:hypothetical protein
VPPQAPVDPIPGTTLLTCDNNAAIYDATGRNVLETVGNARVVNGVKKYGAGAMYFDGTDDRVFTQRLEPLGSGDFTIEGWFYHTSRSVNRGVFQITTSTTGLGAPNTGLALLVLTNGGLNCYAGGATNGYNSSTNVSLNAWHHFAIVRSSGVTKLYINGNLDTGIFTSGSLTDTFNYTSTYLTVGGAFGTSNLWSGYIDDLRITKGVARYTANFTPPSASFPLS